MPLKEVIKLGKTCQRRNNCCKHGSGFLIPEDLDKIANELKLTQDELKKKFLEEKELFNKKMLRPKLKSKMPYGECIFFDDGCKIHSVKPLQCKTGNCSEVGEELAAWFMLNYIVDKDDAESIRQYALYLKSGGKVIPGGKLEDLVPDQDMLKKILDYTILR